MPHVAAPHVIDNLGMAAGLLAMACALILRFALDREVPDKYPAFVALAGVVMTMLHLEAIAGLDSRLVIYFRWVAIAIAMIAGPGSVLWVLENIEPGHAGQAEEKLYEAIEQLERRISQRIR